MCENRYHLRITSNAVGTFSTPNPSPEVIEAVKELVRLAMLREDVRGRVSGRSGAQSAVPATKEQDDPREARDPEGGTPTTKEDPPGSSTPTP